MELEKRIDQLLDTQRILAAQHCALFEIGKAMFSLIPADDRLKTELLNKARHALADEMNDAGMDHDYQIDVHLALDELADSILLAGDQSG